MTTSSINAQCSTLNAGHMAEDRILETYIHNLSSRPSPMIEPYLEYAGFLHVSPMLGGCKLDSTLISVLVEGWRLKTHAFHLLGGECTITFKDVQLQFNLSMDEPVITNNGC
ncbi:hypothetical protein J1N35_037754 [Gossypium stocksii]|uniref:Aminotransferase-like plant mobile domain-containing protein n=1 Tax=Gossypium stocksii TaxID=47602 RepID=A0A9D3ZM76_9ROSI|nr:hypothetical protein J1N35_037754 [Gossypium stocksii]